MPVIELTTTGRRSGRPRATMLTSPYQEGSTIVIVASRVEATTTILRGTSTCETIPWYPCPWAGKPLSGCEPR